MVRGEVPDVDGPTLIADDESGLIGVEAHAVHRSIHLEQPLTLLSSTSGKLMGRNIFYICDTMMDLVLHQSGIMLCGGNIYCW